MIGLRVGRGIGETGERLAELLPRKGVRFTAQREQETAIVSYGYPLDTRLPALNANASKYDKLEQFFKLQEVGIRVPKFFLPDTNPTNIPTYPLLARKRKHVDGADIMPVLQAEDLRPRAQAGAEFFVEYIPRAEEYRVCIYRRQHLASYEKQLLFPDRYQHIGCTVRNGYGLRLIEYGAPAEAMDLAARAVHALELDFGGVDILKGKNGQFYVLEVNSAPGANGDCQRYLNRLAEKIQRWQELGYPKRRETYAN